MVAALPVAEQQKFKIIVDNLGIMWDKITEKRDGTFHIAPPGYTKELRFGGRGGTLRIVKEIIDG